MNKTQKDTSQLENHGSISPGGGVQTPNLFGLSVWICLDCP